MNESFAITFTGVEIMVNVVFGTTVISQLTGTILDVDGMLMGKRNVTFILSS